MIATMETADVVMLGTFSAWNLGTLQARALPFARGLRDHGIRVAIVTTPWDSPAEAGVIDSIDGVLLANTKSVSTALPAAAVREQVEWVERLEPRLVHVMKPRGFGGLAGRYLLRRMPVLVDSDDWEGDGGWNDSGQYGWLQQRVLHAQERDLLRNATAVTGASTLLCQRSHLLRKDDRTYFIPNGLVEDRISQLQAARIHPPSAIDPPTVVLYSRFAEFGPDWFPSFIDNLSARANSPIRVCVIGRDRQSGDPPVRAGSVELIYLGYVASRDVPSLLAAASVAIYPYADSLITRSKQSVKLLELMAAGVPVIASDVGDIARTLEDTGVLLNGADPDAFASAVLDLLADPVRQDDLGARASARVRARYGCATISENLLDAYRAAGLDR